MSEFTKLLYGGEPLPEDVGERWLEIRQLLESAVANVVFTKVNGDERVMRCTLQTDLLPPRPLVEDSEPHAPNYNLLCVWDLDAAAWRSFRITGVRSVEVTQ